MAIGVVALGFLSYSKLQDRDYLRGESVLIWNTAIAFGGLCLLGGCILFMLYRFYTAYRLKLRWYEVWESHPFFNDLRSARRRRGTTLFMVELITQVIGLSDDLSNVFCLILCYLVCEFVFLFGAECVLVGEWMWMECSFSYMGWILQNDMLEHCKCFFHFSVLILSQIFLIFLIISHNTNLVEGKAGYNFDVLQVKS